MKIIDYTKKGVLDNEHIILNISFFWTACYILLIWSLLVFLKIIWKLLASVGII